MAQKYAALAGRTTRPSRALTSQREPIKGREHEMTVNPAGGYSFKADDWAQLDRFLILGVPGNSIYEGQGDMVKQNSDLIDQLLGEDAVRVVETTAEVLRHGRAMKVDAPLFVLAMAAASTDDAGRARALAVLPEVVRTPTQLFTFMNYVGSMRGWGRGLRRAVGRYYTDTPVPKLAMHSWKYKSREGFTHRDALRLAHAKTDDPARNAILRYMVKGELPADHTEGDRALAQIMAAQELLHTTDTSTAVRLIKEHRLTREAVPTALLNEKAVWEALLQDMPVNAMVRNLGKMASVGLTDPLSEAERLIVDRLGSQEDIRGSRIHPMNLLIALKQYERGHGFRGKLSWTANRNIVDALDASFEMAFENVEVTGKRILLAGDDSGSMTFSWGEGVMDGIMTAAEAAAAMMYITYKVEPHTVMIGYSGDYREIPVSRRMTMTSLLRHFGRGGWTDTALPVKFVKDRGLDVDAIVSYTDNCTWSGHGHVTEHLRDYQHSVGHPVRFVNCAMEANRITDTDPANPNMFEIAGLSSSTPRVIGEFIAGRI